MQQQREVAATFQLLVGHESVLEKLDKIEEDDSLIESNKEAFRVASGAH